MASIRQAAANQPSLESLAAEVSLLKRQIASLSSPSRASAVKSQSLQEHIYPLEQADIALREVGEALRAYSLGGAPLSPAMVTSLLEKLATGRTHLGRRMQFYEICDCETSEVAERYVTLLERQTMSPEMDAFVNQARKELALERKEDLFRTKLQALERFLAETVQELPDLSASEFGVEESVKLEESDI
jgi:hypothetical protein